MTASKNRNQMAMIAAPMMPAIRPSKKTIARIFILHPFSGMAPGLLQHWIETTSEVVSILMGWITSWHSYVVITACASLPHRKKNQSNRQQDLSETARSILEGLIVEPVTFRYSLDVS